MSTLFMDSINDERLTIKAKESHPKAERWCGIRGGGTQKRVECYICGCTITTFAGKWPMTKAAKSEVEAHREMHLEEVAK